MYSKLFAASFLLTLAFGSNVLPQDKRFGVFQFEAKRGSHQAHLIVQAIPFNRTKHKVVIDRRNQTFVDTRPAFGTDASIPSREIASMKLYIDGREIHIPKHLYVDCYEPNFGAPFFKVDFNHNARTVLVEMSGADAAASYTVRWWLKRNGRHKRDAYQHFASEDISVKARLNKRLQRTWLRGRVLKDEAEVVWNRSPLKLRVERFTFPI
jgi:hypothetical protein